MKALKRKVKQSIRGRAKDIMRAVPETRTDKELFADVFAHVYKGGTIKQVKEALSCR